MANFFDDDEDDDVQNKLRSPSVAGAGANESFFSPPAAEAAARRPGRAESPGRAVSLRDDSVFNYDKYSPDRDRNYSPFGEARRSPTAADARAGAGDELEAVLGDEYGERQIESNMHKMMRAWKNEAGAPELLHFPNRLVTRFASDIATKVRRALAPLQQVTHALTDESMKREFMKQMSAPTDPSGHAWPDEDNHWMQVGIVSTEIMRASYVLKQLLRERISKVERFARYYLSFDDGRRRMHANEIEHAEGFVRLQDDYYHQSVMKSMPERVRDLNEPVMGLSLYSCLKI